MAKKLRQSAPPASKSHRTRITFREDCSCRMRLYKPAGDYGELWDLRDFPPELNLNSWEAFGWKITIGTPPRPETIAHFLRHSDEPMPEVVRHFIAGLLDKSVKLRRGPRRDLFCDIAEGYRRESKVARVQRLAKRLKRRGVADAYPTALAHVASRTGISEHTLHSWIYPRRR